MNTPRNVHLLSADEAMTKGYRYRRTYIAVCGELIDSSSPSATSYSDDGECQATYCLACLHTATEQDWHAGLDVGCPPGITVITGTRPGPRR